jgi:chromosome partitioning protein
MPVIAVINRKGGSGKSTLATHLAAWCARNGMPVMLGDVDRQQSAQAWLKLRRAQQLPELAPIVGWTVDPRNTLRPPAGISRVVLDTPGGMRGFELARVVMFADAILMPVCNSVFDRESAAECYEELMTLPRVSSGRCKVAAVGMRLDARTKAAEVLQHWAAANKLPFIGVLRETQAYVRCVEQGLTLFDMPASQTDADMAQWKPIVDWLLPVLQPGAAATPAVRPPRRETMPVPAPVSVSVAVPAPAAAAPRPGSSRPAPAAPAHGAMQRIGGLLGRLGVPGFSAHPPPRSRPIGALPWADSTRSVKAP